MQINDQYLNFLPKISRMICERDYQSAIQVLEDITDKETRAALCFYSLALYGTILALVENGEVTVISDKERYERAKIGMEDISPYAVLRRDPLRDTVASESLERMLDFVPEDNPLKQYFRKLEGAIDQG